MKKNNQGKHLEFSHENGKDISNMLAMIDGVKIVYPRQFRLSKTRRDEFKNFMVFLSKITDQPIHALYLNKNNRNPNEIWDFKVMFEHSNHEVHLQNQHTSY